MTGAKQASALFDLPAPPEGVSGWPWTVGSPIPPERSEWPKLTVITPSYMQGEYLETTIRSVLLQGYPNLEYFVLDAGSTDGTREILERYKPWLAGWRSERDAGQAAAINEGWAMGSGEIVAWINSDDWYLPGAFAAVAARFAENATCAWVAGAVDDCDAAGSFLKRHPAAPTPLVRCFGRKDSGYYQPGMFWRRTLIEKVGRLDAGLHNSFDHDFWIRSLLAGFTLEPVEQPVACFRLHSGSKSAGHFRRAVEEDWRLLEKYGACLPPRERRQARDWLRDYEADYLIPTVYRLLLAGERGAALRYLVGRYSLMPRVRPPRAWFGALGRVLLDRPPAWFKG